MSLQLHGLGIWRGFRTWITCINARPGAEDVSQLDVFSYLRLLGYLHPAAPSFPQLVLGNKNGRSEACQLVNQDAGPCVLASFASDVSSCVAVLRLASAWPAAPQRREKTRILFDEANVQRKINKKNQPKKNMNIT